MKHPFYKSIKGRFFLITLVMMLLVGIGASTYSYHMFSKDLTTNSIHSAERNLQFIAEDINESLRDIIYLTDWCRSSNAIASFIMTPRESYDYSRTVAAAANRLTEEYNSNLSSRYVIRIVIAGMEGENFLQTLSNTSYSKVLPFPAVIRSLPYYETLLNASNYDFTIGFQEEPFLSNRPQIIPVIRPIYHTHSAAVIGFIYTEISSSLFIEAAKKYAVSEDATVFFSFGEQDYAITESGILQTEELKSLKEASFDTQISNGSLLRRQPSGEQLYITIPLDAEGCSLTLPAADSKLLSEQPLHFAGILLFILFLIFLLGILLIVSLSRTVTRPVQQLRSRLLQVASGDFSQDASIEWDNEFGDIGKSINQLTVDISNLIEQKISYEKQKKDYELQVLQSQINPHFLYNTLNSIKWMASIQNATGIVEMTTSLSHLMKNIAKGASAIVTIQDEITLLDDYFTIQKYRYGGTISLDYDIEDPALLTNQTLRFTLQPLVENAIFHGIEPKGQNGHISIHIYRNSQKDLRIDITDDGIGMKEDEIAAVLSGESASRSQFFKQIGISSVHKQIQYTFGEAYGLSITSEPGVFTKMSILLPYQPRTEKLLETGDPLC